MDLLEAPPPAPEALFDVRVGWAVAFFLFLAAVDHLLTATVLRERYESDLRRGINRFRWVEYSVSATVMLLLIVFYNGITDIAAVIAIIGANVAMIFFGWLQELINPPGREHTTMLPFWFGTVAGTAPWVAVLVNVVGAGSNVPGFVYGIVVALFVFFLQLRTQPVAAVPRGRQVVELRVRREGLSSAEPGRQVGAGVADLRWLARRLTTGS